MRNFVRKKNMQQILEKLFKIFVFFFTKFQALREKNARFAEKKKFLRNFSNELNAKKEIFPFLRKP